MKKYIGTEEKQNRDTTPAFPYVSATAKHLGVSKREWIATEILKAMVIGAATHGERNTDRFSFSMAWDDGGNSDAPISREIDGKEVKMTYFELWSCEALNLADTLLREAAR